MDTFLQIMGGIFLLLIFVGGSVGLYLWLKWRSFKNILSFKDTPTPSRVHLIPVSSPDWIEEEHAAKAISAFYDLDFEAVGAFRIKEMPPVQLFAFIHEGESLMGVVYRHETVGVWSDAYLEYENGDSLTVSNAPMGGELDTKPGTRKIMDKTLSEIELVERIVEERESGPYRPVSAESFLTRFEESYAADMEWRNSRGGPSKEEIRRVAENMDFRFSEDQIDEAYLESVGDTMERLNHECVGQFIATTDLPVARWEEVRERVFAIHENIPYEMLLEYLEDYAELPEEQWNRMESLMDVNVPVRELFASMSEKLPRELRFEKIGTISEPVKADIYAAPDGDF